MLETALEDAELTARNRYEETPLFVAASEGQCACVAALIRFGAEIDAVNKAGHTPLFRAAGRGHLDVVKLLCQEGADMEALTPHECITPQLWAAKAKQYKVVTYFETAAKDAKKGKLAYQVRRVEEALRKSMRYAPKAPPASDDEDDGAKGKKKGKKGKGKGKKKKGKKKK